MTLASASAGRFRCTQVEDVGLSATRVKSLGLCAGREVELISRGDPMIVEVSGVRIGLSRHLAAFVWVEAK